MDGGELDGAIDNFGRAIALDPEFTDAHVALGVALKDAGRLDEAIAAHGQAAKLHQRAFERTGDHSVIRSNLLYTIHFHPDYDAKAILKEHVQWADIYAEPLTKGIRRPRRESAANPRIRIGYVSPDFRNHVVGRHLLPLLGNHDHERFEIFCYSDVEHEDALTRQFRGYADKWRDTFGKSDAQLADLILSDGMDILVDLMLHMSGARPLMFAQGERRCN